VLGFLLEKAKEDAPAFVRATGEEMTYGSLAVAVRAVADALVQGAGELKHRALGVAVEDQAGFLVSVLAGFMLDAVVVPIDVRVGSAEVKLQAGRAQVAAMVVGDTADDRLEVIPVATSHPAFDTRAALALAAASSPAARRRALLPLVGLEATVDGILGYLPVDASSRTPLLSSLAFSDVLVGQAMVTLRAGGALVGLGEITSPAAALDAIVRLGCDGVSATPSALHVLADVATGRPEIERPKLRYVASAGAPLDAPTVDKLRLAFPRARVFNQYGLAEAPRVTAISERDPMFARGSVGKALPGLSVREQGGELYVQGPPVMLGYLDDPEATRRVLTADGLRTGDRGHVDGDGYVWIDRAGSGRSS
jgi:acyl-CoA synthetase (AMP-forming)/AMP-acid ligase II